MAPAPYPMYASRTATSIDVHSREALEIPNVSFIPCDQHHLPATVYRCRNAVGTCTLAKEWHYREFGHHSTPDLLRMDSQALHNIDNKKEGTVIFLQSVGDIPINRDGNIAIHIMALLMPKDSRIRFFYSTTPYDPLIKSLEEAQVIEYKKSIAPSLPSHRAYNPKTCTQTRDLHCRIFTFLESSFLGALNIPHAPEYLNAMAITDFAPDISDPDTALQRIERLAGEQSWPSGRYGDVSEDRYLTRLHPAERELASATDLKCAEYLLIKRVFFKDFYEEVTRTEKKIGTITGQGKNAKLVRARSEMRHIQWFEDTYGWGKSRAKRMVVAWEVLGLLDERKFLPWIKAGGMLAESNLVDEVDYEDGDDGMEDAITQVADTEAATSRGGTPDT